jgi:hypothetical protein
MSNTIPMTDCIKGKVYRIKCRNLSFGVYDGNGGFIGIREKMGNVFLFTEFHWDQGPPYGTVHSVEELTIEIPTDILIQESLGVFDPDTKRYIEFRPEEQRLTTDQGPGTSKGKWYFVGTNEECESHLHSHWVPNTKLFMFLKEVERDNPIYSCHKSNIKCDFYNENMECDNIQQWELCINGKKHRWNQKKVV